MKTFTLILLLLLTALIHLSVERSSKLKEESTSRSEAAAPEDGAKSLDVAAIAVMMQ